MRSKYGIAMLIALVACLVIGPALAIPQTPISIVDFEFQPGSATEEVGISITWTNLGEFEHTVTFDALDIDSGSIAPGETFSTTLAQAGTYTYHCSIHGNMTGTITVIPQQAPPDLVPRLWLPITIRSQD